MEKSAIYTEPVVSLVGLIGLVILFWGFPQYVYFPSQNAATHALLARAMSQPDYQQQWLSHSFFQGKFIDQQWGYSWLLSIVQNWLPIPWQAERLIQVLFLVASCISIWGLLYQLSKALKPVEKSEWWLSWAALGWTLALAPQGVWFRMYLLRIEAMVLFFVLSTFALMIWIEGLTVKRKFLHLFLIASILWLGSLFSYILWILILPLLIIPRRFRDRMIYLLIFLLVWALSFWWRGEFILQWRYAFELLTFTMSGGSGIREWEPLRLNLETMWPLVLGVLGWMMALWQNAQIRNRFWLAYFSVAISFVLGSVLYQRFVTLAYFMNIPIIIYLSFTWAMEKIRCWLSMDQARRSLWVGGLVTIFGFIGVTVWWVKTPREFQRWNDELYNYHETVQSLPRYVPPGETVIIASWEHWSILSWHIPQNSFEPGYSTLIYELMHPRAVKCLNSLRNGRLLAHGEAKRCLLDIRTFFQSRWFLLDKANATKQKAILLLKRLLLPLRFVWENSEAALFEINDDLNFNEWLSVSHSVPNKLKWLDPHVLLHPRHGIVQSLSAQGRFDGEYDIGGPFFSWTRSLMSAWVFCELGLYLENTCKQLVKTYQSYRSQWKKGLGNQAFLGLLSLNINEPGIVQQQWESVQALLSPSGLWQGVRYGERSAIFYPGEALVFVFRKLYEDCVKVFQTDQKSQALNGTCRENIRGLAEFDKIEKSYFWYLFSWMLTRDPFYLRWLTEVVFLREKMGWNTHFEKKILIDSYFFWGSLYCYARQAGVSPTWSPLLNEGFSYFLRNSSGPLDGMMQGCAAAAISSSHPQVKGQFFLLRSKDFTLRDDLQAHGLNGFRDKE